MIRFYVQKLNFLEEGVGGYFGMQSPTERTRT